MSLGAAWVVFLKELTDGIRDRRSIFSALLYPLIGPLLIGLMFNVIAEQQKGAKAIELPVAGRSHGEPLVQFLESNGVVIQDAPEDPEQAVASGEVPMVLVIPEEFPAEFEKLEPAHVNLVVDGSRNDTRADVGRVRMLISAWGSQMAGLRLVARGVSPQVAMPVLVDEVDVASPEQFSANVLNFIPMFVLMAAFIGGMQVAIDTTAGERERKSLEPLLTTPVDRLSVTAGKWLAGVVFGSVGVLLTVACCVVVVGRLPLEELGLRLQVGPREVVGLAAAALPMVPLAVGLQMLMGTFARSYKEAQTYMSLLIFLPMLPGLVMSLSPSDGSTWTRLVPSLGQQQLMTDVLGGQPGWIGPLVGASLICIALGLGLVAVTAWLFGREKIVYG